MAKPCEIQLYRNQCQESIIIYPEVDDSVKQIADKVCEAINKRFALVDEWDKCLVASFFHQTQFDEFHFQKFDGNTYAVRITDCANRVREWQTNYHPLTINLSNSDIKLLTCIEGNNFAKLKKVYRKTDLEWTHDDMILAFAKSPSVHRITAISSCPQHPDLAHMRALEKPLPQSKL